MQSRLRHLAVAFPLCCLVTAQSPGLRVFSPSGANATQLVDSQGSIVHTWPGVMSTSVHISDDGFLLRSQQTGTFTIGGATGRLQRMDYRGAIQWDMLIDGPLHFMHHDIEPMPNGNVLVIAWHGMTAADAIAAGRDPASIAGGGWFPDAILEIQQTGPTSGAIVWQWHLMDHIIQDFDASKANFGVVANHPELLDINYPPLVLSNGDYNHANGLDYDPINDWIMLSARAQNEIYLIDHSTTTVEAAGHTGGQRGKGGDMLYRWGNPEAYDAGTAADQQLFGQHDPRFVRPGYPGEGHVTLFNNIYQTGQSAIFELALPLDTAGDIVMAPSGQYGPATPAWLFTEPGFYSQFVSSAQRLKNGNTLICSGVQGRLFEVTPAGATAWNYDYTGPGFMFQTHLVERTLWTDTATLSVAGGQVAFDHLVDARAGHVHLLLGSLSGSLPGVPLPGGAVLPINYDGLTDIMLNQWNVGIFGNTLGFFDGDGHGTSTIFAPPGFLSQALAGLEIDFAHFCFDLGLQEIGASNAVRVTIVP